MNKVLERSNTIGLFGSLILVDFNLVGLPAWEHGKDATLLYCVFGKASREASRTCRIKVPNRDILAFEPSAKDDPSNYLLGRCCIQSTHGGDYRSGT